MHSGERYKVLVFAATDSYATPLEVVLSRQKIVNSATVKFLLTDNREQLIFLSVTVISFMASIYLVITSLPLCI